MTCAVVTDVAAWQVAPACAPVASVALVAAATHEAAVADAPAVRVAVADLVLRCPA